jgi:hypothetical protein
MIAQTDYNKVDEKEKKGFFGQKTRYENFQHGKEIGF